mgnify:CR=1 FL=1
MAETKTYTAKAGLSDSDLQKSRDKGLIHDGDTVEVMTRNKEEVPGMNTITRSFELETPTTNKEAVSFADASDFGAAFKIVGDLLVTKARNAIAQSIKPSDNKLADLKAQVAKSQSQSARLIEATRNGDTELVASIIAEMEADAS